jgi:predicted amidohydrolase
MSPTLKIAAAQCLVTPDIRANGRHIRDLIHHAHEAGARLAHFPECAISGYTKSQIRDWGTIDWGALREELEETAGLCRSLGIWAVIGCAHRLTPPSRPHNSLYVISDGGELVGRYDKRRCSNTEITDWFSPGFEPFAFEVDGYSFGCSLCIEIQFPELFMEYERLGADAILFSSYSKDQIYGTIARSHAAMNCMWLSFSVPAQCSQAVPASVIGPNGQYVAQCDRDGKAGFCTVTLDRSVPEFEIALKRARPWRRRARTGSIYAERYVEDTRSCEKRKF